MAEAAGKVALITGATSGIGKALAEEFYRRGASVVLLGRRAERLEELQRKLSPDGARALAIPCDVTRDGELEKAVALAREKFGRLDIVVANAGFGVVGDIEQLELEDFRRQFETNVFGVLRTVRAVLADLKASKGALALVGSVNGFVALPGNAPYAMSKFAVRALADSLWLELAPFGVAVTHIAPGFVESEIRQVDNRGTHHPRARDRVPAWIQMPADRAARKIASAVLRRKREAVITTHGKCFVWLERHLPWLVRRLIRVFQISARPEP